MDKQISPERSIKTKNDGFSMELQLLPCDVLNDILSRLSIKEVFRMSTLSRQWRQLGICHPYLVFTEETFFGTSNTINPSASMAADSSPESTMCCAHCGLPQELPLHWISLSSNVNSALDSAESISITLIDGLTFPPCQGPSTLLLISR